jgi:predicted GNAT family N-acyltransferase
MTGHAFRIVEADYARDLPHLRHVRETVFVHEQQVPLELEWDEFDPVCAHVLALDAAGAPIGAGRLVPDAAGVASGAESIEIAHRSPWRECRIGRMAVLSPWRGRGVGAALLVRLVDAARARGCRRIELHAQVSALRFYERHGFAAYGEVFDEAGIPHRHMRRDLAEA